MNKIEEYEKLYMINGNSDVSIDYNVLTTTYISYLYVFLTGPGDYKNFKGNIAFLHDVVYGFDYYQAKLFEDSSVDDITLVNYINSKSMEISISIDNKTEEDQITDGVYMVTYSCQNMVNNSSYPFAPILIRQMFSNSCNIESTINKYKGDYKGM